MRQCRDAEERRRKMKEVKESYRKARGKSNEKIEKKAK